MTNNGQWEAETRGRIALPTYGSRVMTRALGLRGDGKGEEEEP
ncbi:hypothetical protein AKJ09_00806 [Labilithrix luteola]|uniref:Uncharacterized protein n=1 Tax=Labilithrix luteola TaxID=1391654 RepID=A0A0K1PKU2_9BACT|nr:hypothetical protein [Labilithrix luteola]AKU94142.1 hypothetical protein AKJ09_00806 [Labilithrix luteola]